MSQDSVLKKEFKSKDVERLRNLVQGKYGERTSIGIGYQKPQEFHKEGDIWEENGRKWTIKDGIKQNITKLDKAKKTHLVPLFCPNCKKPMKKHFDKDYYNIYRMCFDCVIDFEHNLKKLGLWEEYEKNIINSDIDGFIKDFKAYAEEEINQTNESFITEQGDVEKWTGNINKQKILDTINKVIENLENNKK